MTAQMFLIDMIGLFMISLFKNTDKTKLMELEFLNPMIMCCRGTLRDCNSSPIMAAQYLLISEMWPFSMFFPFLFQSLKEVKNAMCSMDLLSIASILHLQCPL